MIRKVVCPTNDYILIVDISEFGHFSRNAEYIQEQIIDGVIYSKVINTRKMDDTKLQLQENKQVNHFKR